jgi:hypothetical protein
MKSYKEKLSHAMLEPDDVYNTPKDLMLDTSLDLALKIHILENWKDQIHQVLRSSEENMHPELDSSFEIKALQDIEKSLAELNILLGKL